MGLYREEETMVSELRTRMIEQMQLRNMAKKSISLIAESVADLPRIG